MSNHIFELYRTHLPFYMHVYNHIVRLCILKGMRLLDETLHGLLHDAVKNRKHCLSLDQPTWYWELRKIVQSYNDNGGEYRDKTF